MDSGQSVTWTVLIDTDVDDGDLLTVRWSLADNEIPSTFNNKSKHQIVTESNQTSLTVRHLTSNDSAVYHLAVSLGKEKQTLNFTLKIRGCINY